MEYEPPHTDSMVSPRQNDVWRLAISATLSVVVVISVGSWYMHQALRQRDADLSAARGALEDGRARYGTSSADSLAASFGATAATSSTPEEIAQIGTNAIGRLVTDYAILASRGIYNPQLGAQVAESIASTVEARVPYALYDAKSLTTDPDTSYDRMRSYRTDLQSSLAPLKKNKAYELELYSTYVATRDATRLTELKTAAQNYRDAAGHTAKVAVPADAVSSHVGILNAMQEFAATLDFMVDNADDPITSLALLKAYNKAEADMFASFGSLDAYYAGKRP